MIRIRLFSIVAILGLASIGAAQAGDAAKGLDIAKRTEARNDGFNAFRGTAKMILKDRSGAQNVRDFIAVSREISGDGDQNLIQFQTPLDVKGLSVLTHAHAALENDQWLYLPAASRVRRIASSSRSGSFAGSEFSYEDLVGYVVEKHDYAWLRDEPCPDGSGLTCYVNEQRPKEADSGYSRIVVWIDQKELRALKLEFYDRRNAHIKTLINSDFEIYKGKYWRSKKLVMNNHQTGKSTEMIWANYDFDAPVSAEEMQPHALGR